MTDEFDLEVVAGLVCFGADDGCDDVATKEEFEGSIEVFVGMNGCEMLG